MKSRTVLGLALVAALLSVGCANLSSLAGHSPGYSAPRRAPTYALAVTVHGALQPTPQQWASIQAKLADELAWRGAILVTDLALAERIIRLDFTPNPNDPETSGRLTLLGVRLNPYYGYSNRGVLAGAGAWPTYSFSHLMTVHRTGWWGASNFYSGDYYNYYGPWENGYTASVALATAPKPPPAPPQRHARSDRELCPPDALHPSPRLPASHAGLDAARTLHSGSEGATPTYTSPEPARGRWNGERSAWRSEASVRTAGAIGTGGSSSSRGERSGYARSDRSSGWSRSDSSAESSWRSRQDSYTRNDSGASYSSSSQASGTLTASSAHVTPAYTSPSPAYSSSAASSGSLSTGAPPSPSPPAQTTESNTIER